MLAAGCSSAPKPRPNSETPNAARARRRLAIPSRPPGAESGSELFARVERSPFSAYEAAIVEAVERGNVPTFERELVRVELEASIAGRRVSGAVFVSCDYLAVGSDEDFLRAPLTPGTAQRVCKALDCSLPTPKLVDAIYRAAPAKLTPAGMQTGDVGTRHDFLAHQRAIEAQRAQRGVPLGELIAGIKKDIVLTAQLAAHPDRVAIYGWHKEDGEPVQKLSTLHAKGYADYSHGIRLVAQDMLVDGKPRRLGDVLRDPELAELVSGEGPLATIEYPS